MFPCTWLLLILSLTYLTANARQVFPDAPGMGTGGSQTATPGVAGLFYNPATMDAGGPEFQGSILLPYSGIGLKGLSAGLLLPAGPSVAGTSLYVIGDDIYQYSVLSAGLAGDFGDFRLGIRPEWHRENMQGIATWNHLYTSAGLLLEPGSGVRLGISIRKRLAGANEHKDESSLAAAIDWRASRQVSISGEWKNLVGSAGTISFALRYTPSGKISLLTAWRMVPARFHFGVIFSPGSQKIIYSAALDPILGFSQALSLHWSKPASE